MVRSVAAIVLLGVPLMAPCAEPERQPLKPREGEVLLGGSVILKATAASGTGGAEMLMLTLAPGQSGELQRHGFADSFFHVASGKGSVVIGNQESAIASGDSFFVPRGTAHRLKNSDAALPMTLVVFLDKPGLADALRARSREREQATRR